jgi:hypothetical protein
MREHPKISTPRRVTTTVDCKCTSNDADLVKLDEYIVPKNKKAKNLPLEPWPLPEFEVEFQVCARTFLLRLSRVWDSILKIKNK